MAGVSERLWAKIECGALDECWPFQGARVSFGYGQLRVNGRGVYAHRLVEEEVRGPLEAGEVVRHDCDNPCCCNPAHLQRGTQKDNVRDSIARGRFNAGGLPGEDNGFAKLTDEQVMEMRERYAREHVSQIALAREHGVSGSLVNGVVTGRMWKHLPMPERSPVHGAGLCRCGCGHATSIAKMTNRRLGHVKGQPTYFLKGHWWRVDERGRA